MNNINNLLEIIKSYNIFLDCKLLVYNIDNDELIYKLSQHYGSIVKSIDLTDLEKEKKFTTIISNVQNSNDIESFIQLLEWNGIIILKENNSNNNLYNFLSSKSLIVYKYFINSIEQEYYYICIKNKSNLLSNHMSLQAYVYDLYTENYNDDINFLSSWIKDKEDILEIGVGTGRIALELSKARQNYYGLDYSSSMLNILKEKNKELNRPLTLVNQNMLEFTIDKKFDAILYPFRVFPYCKNKDEILKTLLRSKSHLKDFSSRILINMINFDEDYIQQWHNKYYNEKFVNANGAIWTKIDYMLFNKDKNLMYREISILNELGDTIIKTEDSLFWLSADDLCNLCKEIGFKIYNIWPAYTYNMYKGEWEYIISIGIDPVHSS